MAARRKLRHLNGDDMERRPGLKADLGPASLWPKVSLLTCLRLLVHRQEGHKETMDSRLDRAGFKSKLCFPVVWCHH